MAECPAPCWAAGNPCAFDLNTTGFGNEGRNSLIGPPLRDFDFSVLKNLPVGETKQFQFRAEMFNIFNQTCPLT